MTKKGIDMIAANLVDNDGTGFNSDDNELTVFWRDKSRILEKQSKEKLARKLVTLISKVYRESL